MEIIFGGLLGTVMDESPYGFEGRVKIRVHGLHSPETYLLPQQDLPWGNVFFQLPKVVYLGLVKFQNYKEKCKLVFGFFMDSDESQTPIVLGSLPHIEIPTLIQNNQQFEDVGDDSKSSNVFTRFESLFET